MFSVLFNWLITEKNEELTMEQPDHDECRIEVKQELEEDPLAGQPNFDTTLWTNEILPIHLLVWLWIMMMIQKPSCMYAEFIK